MFYGRTRVIVCSDYHDLGRRAAHDVAMLMREMLKIVPELRIIFAAAESQMTFLDALAAEPDVDWRRVVCFDMDEFWGPDLPETATCAWQLRRQLYDRVLPAAWHAPRWNAPDPFREAAEFAAVFRKHRPIHILCQGIGRSGHLALNEPGAASFSDTHIARVVDVCGESTRQLHDDPNFREAANLLKKGITLTIPALMSATHKFTIVPLASKKPVLEKLFTMQTPSEKLPASIIRNYPGRLYVDADSCPESLRGRHRMQPVRHAGA